MGNTISNCCHSHNKETSSFNPHLLPRNSKHKASAKGQKLGRKKNVRFVDNKKSTAGIKSSKLRPNDNGPLNCEIGSSATQPASDRSMDTDAAVPSGVVSVEDVNDIKSIFIFDKQIGDGKFGTVFLAHPRVSPKTWVAVKLIPQKAFSYRIEKELSLLKSIEHPHVIKYISAYKDKSFFYIVTEYCEGGELFKKIVDQGGMDELEACQIMAKLLSAVKFLHDRNICHRDLKPENILFKRHNDDTIKLIDFGLSKQLEEGEIMKKKLGTPYYLAPEVLEESYGKEVDLWSLGVVAYVLLWGYPPFYGQDAKELFINIYNVNYDFADEDWDFISDEAKDFVSKLLVKDPSERMTIDEALAHSWIVSGHGVDSISSEIEDSMKSSISDVWCLPHKRLEVSTDILSKSAECTTYDSYEKWLMQFTRSISDEQQM